MKNGPEMNNKLLDGAAGEHEDVRVGDQALVITLRDFWYPDSARKQQHKGGGKEENKMLPEKKKQTVSTNRTPCTHQTLDTGSKRRGFKKKEHYVKNIYIYK